MHKLKWELVSFFPKQIRKNGQRGIRNHEYQCYQYSPLCETVKTNRKQDGEMKVIRAAIIRSNYLIIYTLYIF